MGNRIVVCHWNNGGGWDAIEVSTSALGGHENHERDIWPPVEGVTGGQNWERGEDVWVNGCAVAASPEPTPSVTGTQTPSPSSTLPDTGAEENAMMAVVGVSLIAVGAWMKVRSRRHAASQS